ncbi:MAG TPA: phosphoribosylamine--glycine ligase, partial [Candidatus Dormibacteraeota bacterium]|nr:phosphoribosylamine--glycine ligase [Candidatus Dormibacteraeota bacterium]
GSGARAHALAWKCLKSPLAERVYVAPGNGGTAAIARNVAVPADDPVRLTRLARKEKIGLAILGPDAAVAAGVGDALRDAGIAVFGPDRDAGRIESSKSFAKEVMVAAGIPTAAHGTFTEPEPARRFARKFRGRVAVKADGLALGKGVLVCDDQDAAERAIEAMLVKHAFGLAGSTIVVEERLEGPELSVFGVCDGKLVTPLAAARDFKRALDRDQGPNTGGMGAYSPPAGVTDEMVAEVTETALRPAVHELARRGLDYRGVLYAGLMLTSDGPRVLEFNARFGDPETQVVLPRLKSDLVPLMLAAALGDVGEHPRVEWWERPAVGVVVASGGYPESYETGHVVDGLGSVPDSVLIFHAGTRQVPGRGLVTSGGRVLTSVGMGADVEQARMAALSGAVRVRFPGAFYRKDIAQEAVGA